MQTFTSQPLEIPPLAPGRTVSRADLVVYGVEHRGGSYEVRAFLDVPDADHRTPLDPAAGYAGSFTVFGHGGCFGDEGHCDPAARVTDRFDLRLPNKVTPFTKVVQVTSAIRSRTEESATATSVRLVCVRPGDGAAEPSDEMAFTALRLVTYE